MAPETCAYTYERTRFRCDLPVWKEGTPFCILHDRRKEKDLALFQKTLEEKVDRETLDASVMEINLTGVFFPSDLDWSDKKIGKLVSFRGARFSGAADFSWADFSGDADFREARFSGAADFSLAGFSGEANFFEASFSEDASFLRARFSGAADFSWASFGGDASFSRVSFRGDADFHVARFSGAAGFSGVGFSGDAEFSWASFKETVVFERTRFPPEGSPRAVSFERVTFQRPAATYFWHVDLSRASFLYTDVREVRFVGVTWAGLPEHALWPLPWGWKAKRHGIRSHLELEEERRHGKAAPVSSQAAKTRGTEVDTEQREQVLRTYRAVAEQYRQLRLNFEASKQEIEAGDFYIGQMDMRRLDHKQYGRLYCAFLWLYRAVALYGESYWRPLFFYFLLAPLFAIGYRQLGCVSHADGLFTALTAGALFRDIPLCVDGGEKLLVYVNTLLDILLLGLALVALRRRFHR